MKRLAMQFALLLCGFLLSSSLYGQFTVSGNVQDEADEPLIGVSIIVDGTTSGTVTDFDGNFSVDIPEGNSASLLFSYTGYKSVRAEVTRAQNIVELTMEEDIARLDEVVITGLASNVKRSNSGNAITSVTGEELTENTNIQTLDGALYGKVPGVLMQSQSGAPGGGINMQLRGISTLGAGSSQPLFIIDGVYVDNSVIRTGRTQVNGASGGQNASSQDDVANRIADINPDDIEKIEILKGPSAAAIYGTRANAGVVIITTKQGQAGRTRVSLSQDIGFAEGQNFIGFDDWDEEKVINFFGSGDAGQAELEKLQQAQAEGRVTDWEEYLYGETPLLSNTQLSLSGGNQKTQFYLAGGIQTEDGIIERTGFDRYSVRANLNHRINDKIKVGVNSNYINNFTRRGFTGNQNNTGGSLGYNIAYTPTYADLFPDEFGNYPDNDYFNDNPIAIRDLGDNELRVNRFIIAGNAEWDILQSANSFLKFKVNGGVDYLSGNSEVYFPEILQHQRAQALPGDVMWGRQDVFNTNIQAFLTYNTNLGTLNTNTTVGAIRLDQEQEFVLNRGRGLISGQNNLGYASNQSVQEQTFQEVTDIGYVIQEDLNWEDKIVASLGIRFDRSTLNRDQEKFYAFPRASVAVNLHEFGSWASNSIFNRLKLRAAYGETGGLPNFGVTFNSLTQNNIDGNVGTVVSTRGVDPNLDPETASEIEFGVDLGMLDERITLEATYYNKQVNDLILDLVPATSTGITAIATNAGDLENRGVELALGLVPVRNPNFNWNLRTAWWTNVSEITRLDIPPLVTGGFGNSLGRYLIAEGYSPTTIVGNPTGSDDTPVGLTVYGDRQPDWQLSVFNQINFLKNFDFNFLLHYQNGGEAINLSALLWDLGGTAPGWDDDADGDGTLNGPARIAEWSGGNTGVYIQPTDYIKLREVGLYYTIPKTSLPDFLQKVRVGISANNLLLSTDYGSYDPEVSNFGIQAVTGNIEVTPYPTSRRFFFHLNLDF